MSGGPKIDADSSAERGRRRDRLWVTLGVIAIFWVAAIPLILWSGSIGRAAFDQLNFHEPAVRIFAHDWPALDLKNYLSATTPGYHVLLALVARYVSGATIALQLAGSIFTAALLVVLAWIGSERASWRIALATTLAVGASSYVFFPGVWMLPDNAGWLGVVGVFALALRRRVDAITFVGAAVLLVAVVLMRQIHIWTAGLIVVAAVLKPSAGDEAGSRGSSFDTPGRTAGRVALAIVAAVPAVLVLAYFRGLWQGLTPPLFQYQYLNAGTGLGKLNLAAPALMLAMIGLYGPFFVAWWGQGLVEAWRKRWGVVLAVLVGAMILLVVPPTTYSDDQSLGRWDGLWALSRHLPNIARHTSSLILALGLVGTAALIGFGVRLPGRDAAIFLAGLAGYSATQAVAFQLWQRYHEPIVLIVLAWMAWRARVGERRWRKMEGLGPALLVVALAGVTTATLLRAKVDRKLPPEQLMSELFPSAPKALTPRMTP